MIQSGAVYTYDYFASDNDSAANPGKFAFGQQIYGASVSELDQFGSAIDYTNGIMLIGSPSGEHGDSALAENNNYGAVLIFTNPDLSPAWVVTNVQQPVVDIALINGVFAYDRVTSAKTTFCEQLRSDLGGRQTGSHLVGHQFCEIY